MVEAQRLCRLARESHVEFFEFLIAAEPYEHLWQTGHGMYYEAFVKTLGAGAEEFAAYRRGRTRCTAEEARVLGVYGVKYLPAVPPSEKENYVAQGRQANDVNGQPFSETGAKVAAKGAKEREAARETMGTPRQSYSALLAEVNSLRAQNTKLLETVTLLKGEIRQLKVAMRAGNSAASAAKKRRTA